MSLKKRSSMILKALISTLVMGASASYAEVQEANERVATEDLVEGIKSRDGRWFEVELIVFERKDNQDFREVFDQKVLPLEKSRQWDLVREQLQPDVTQLLNLLPECHQGKNPLLKDPIMEPLEADEFFQQMMEYKKLISGNWQFTNELCLLPDESLSGYWQYDNDFTPLLDSELTHVPIEQIPEQVTAGDHDDFHNVYLLAEQNLQLKEQFYTLKGHPQLNPLLHIGWRQPGLSKRRSIPVYLVAGKNYTEQYRYDGSEIIKIEEPVIEPEDSVVTLTAEETLNQDTHSNLDIFMQQLQSGAVVDFQNNQLVFPSLDKMPKQTWQLDGYIQVHLNHYLFIDSEFNFREESTKLVTPEDFIHDTFNGSSIEQVGVDTEIDQAPAEQIEINYLQNYYFKQNRRVYSGDVHYLDHPKFGILIQIRKYRH